MDAITKVAEVLNRAKSVWIASHMVPDGDCIGSTIALALGLKSREQEVIAINGDPVPETYRFLKGSDLIKLPSSLNKIPDVVVLVDCTDLDRAGEEIKKKLETTRCIINIDHHVSNSYFGHINYVKEEASATGQLVSDLIKEMRIKITPEIATALYTAIVTDTGSFQYENTSPEAFRLAAEFLENGADHNNVRNYLWERKPLSSILLLKEVLPTLTFAEDGKVAWMFLSRKLYNQLGLVPEYCEGLINYPRAIEGVEVALFFRELEDGRVKVGLRSKNYVNVNEIACLLGGGGHQRAAGCTVEGPLEKAIQLVVLSVRERL